MSKKKPTCSPKMWGVIHDNVVTYGWKCPTHGEHGKRYSTEELRDHRMAEHVKEHSKKQKKN